MMSGQPITPPTEKAPGFWRTVLRQDRLGYRFIVGLVFFPVILGLYAVAAQQRSSIPLSVGVIVAAAGWLAAWVIVIRAHRRSRSGDIADLTPWGPLIVPILVMLGGVFAPLASL